VHSTERQMLVSSMSAESRRSFGVVAISGVCFALLTLMAVIGAPEKDAAVPQAASNSPHSASAAILPSAAVHRKAVFDDRRAKFIGTAWERGATGLAQGPAATAIALVRPAASESMSETNCSGGADGGMAANGNQCSE
jgi:hypothetical protein